MVTGSGGNRCSRCPSNVDRDTPNRCLNSPTCVSSVATTRNPRRHRVVNFAGTSPQVNTSAARTMPRCTPLSPSDPWPCPPCDACCRPSSMCCAASRASLARCWRWRAAFSSASSPLASAAPVMKSATSSNAAPMPTPRSSSSEVRAAVPSRTDVDDHVSSAPSARTAAPNKRAPLAAGVRSSSVSSGAPSRVVGLPRVVDGTGSDAPLRALGRRPSPKPPLGDAPCSWRMEGVLPVAARASAAQRCASVGSNTGSTSSGGASPSLG